MKLPTTENMTCAGFLNVLKQITTNLVAKKKKNLFFYSLGRPKFKTKLSAGWFFLGTLKEKLSHASLPTYGGC